MTTIIEDNNEEEIKQYHREKLFELSKKSIDEIPQLDEPTDEQKEWIIRTMRRRPI
jgi:hypothetical protein